MNLTRKQFFDAVVKTEKTFYFSGKTIKVFKLAYLPDGHKFFNFTIEETNKKRAWEYFKTLQQCKQNYQR